MFQESVNYQINSLDKFTELHVLAEALQAVSENSYGVGGVLINLNNGAIIKKMHNTVIAKEDPSEQSRLKDPTAHGERQLVDWYFANKIAYQLPEPEDILLVTSLDPCLMCTGSILAAGFTVIIVALDDNAGINWDNSYTFKPLEGALLVQVQKNFIYPDVTYDIYRMRHPDVPLFTKTTLSCGNTKACLEAFNVGADVARDIVENMIPKEDLIDLSENPDNAVVKALRAEYSDALKYKTDAKDRAPDEGLAAYLIAAAKEDFLYGGDGDAVAFLDHFGNLLMCKSGKKSESPIRSAFMETARAYQKVRYELSKTSNDKLKYLCDPSLGSFIFVKGFDKSASSFADMGAYGSTLLNTPKTNNLQYITERIPHADLTAYIEGMSERYRDKINPLRVTDEKLKTAVESGVVKPGNYQRCIDIDLPEDFYMRASASFQTAGEIAICIKDGANEIFSCRKDKSKIEHTEIMMDYKTISKNGIKLYLDVSEIPIDSDKVKLVQSYRSVNDVKGREKAREYSLFVDGWTDDDYNDIHIVITAWKSLG